MDENRSIDVRRVRLHVTVGGHNATDYIKPDLVEFAYTDNAKGKADEVSLTLADPDGKWQGAWKPKKGLEVTARLECRDWFAPDVHASLPMGRFTVDKTTLSGPPDKVTVKAVSAAKTSAMSEEKNTRGWENFDLQGIGSELAGKHGLELMHDAPEHKFQRVDQREESDLAFLNRLCKERGVNLKVHDGRMILFGAKEWDAKPPRITIYKSGDHFTRSGITAKTYSFEEESQGTAEKAEVDYHDPAENKNHTATVKAEGPPPSGQSLKLNTRVESGRAAIALGESALREKNEKANTANIEIMGHPGLVAGITLSLEGFGEYDGSYFVEKAEHKIGSGYSTSAELRKTLGY